MFFCLLLERRGENGRGGVRVRVVHGAQRLGGRNGRGDQETPAVLASAQTGRDILTIDVIILWEVCCKQMILLTGISPSLRSKYLYESI